MARRYPIFFCAILSIMVACAKLPERKIDFVYVALGASDAAGVGALPLTEGYVYLIKRELDRHRQGVALLNLGVPGARVDLIKEQVRVAEQVGTKAQLVTLWTGANDLVHGDDPKRFQADLHRIFELLEEISDLVIVANLPDLTRLPRFQRDPSPVITIERVVAFNQAIAEEARRAKAHLVNLFAQPIQTELVFDVDGFHPNDAGHRELARLFLAQILPAVATR